MTVEGSLRITSVGAVELLNNGIDSMANIISKGGDSSPTCNSDLLLSSTGSRNTKVSRKTIQNKRFLVLSGNLGRKFVNSSFIFMPSNKNFHARLQEFSCHRFH